MTEGRFAGLVERAPVALEALARRTVLTCLLTRLGRCCCALSGRHACGFARRSLARFSEIAVATAAAVALRALAFGSLRAFRGAAVMALTVAIVMRATLVGSSAGPPDLDELRLGGCFSLRFCFGLGLCGSLRGRGHCGSAFGRRFARSRRLGFSFRSADGFRRLLLRRRIQDRGFRRRDFRRSSLFGYLREGRDFREQR